MATTTATDLTSAVNLLVPDTNIIHDIINGDADTDVAVENGYIPTIRKVYADTLYFLSEVETWTEAEEAVSSQQLYNFGGLLYWAPSATGSNTVPLGTTPVGDSNWQVAPTRWNYLQAVAIVYNTTTDNVALLQTGDIDTDDGVNYFYDADDQVVYYYNGDAITGNISTVGTASGDTVTITMSDATEYVLTTNNIASELDAVAIANNTTVDNVAFLYVGASLSGQEYLRVVSEEKTKIAVTTISGIVTSYTENSVTVDGDEIELINDKYKPDSISQAKKINYTLGCVVKTGEYYSDSELTEFGVSKPQGGGARYIVVDSTGLTEDTVKYHALNNGNFLELLDVPNSRNAGMVGNYIDESNKGFDNLAKAQALDNLNTLISGRNYFHGGNFYMSAPTLVLNSDSRGEGNYLTNFYVEQPVDLTPVACVTINDKTTIRDIAFHPASTTQTKTFITNDFEDLFVSSFDYNEYLYGPNVGGECAVIDCAGRSFDRGLQGRSGTKNVTIVRGDYWGASWGASFYNVELLSFDGTKIYGGSVGGLGMPSCRHVTIGGGVTVYNPNGTGINTGGSNATGFNAEDINIGSCNVYARDCINLENGCVSANVSGYKIYVVTELAVNGIAIGVYSRETDNGGHVSNIAIGPGKIEGSGDGSYSHAVRIGFNGNTVNAEDVKDITVSGVSATGCRIGCETVAPANASLVGFKASGNSFNSSLYGYAMTNTHSDGSIDGGDCTYSGDTTISGTYGIRFGALTRFVFNGVKLQGYATHYRQDGTVTNSWVTNPIGVVGRDSAAFTEINNQSGGSAIVFYRTTS